MCMQATADEAAYQGTSDLFSLCVAARAPLCFDSLSDILF